MVPVVTSIFGTSETGKSLLANYSISDNPLERLDKSAVLKSSEEASTLPLRGATTSGERIKQTNRTRQNQPEALADFPQPEGCLGLQHRDSQGPLLGWSDVLETFFFQDAVHSEWEVKSQT